MNAIIRALLWEQVWKNRVVIPCLGLLLAVGAALTVALSHAPGDVWWAVSARTAISVAFLASLLLGYAPFTLMESAHGWRMNSMVTRWFVLPVSTSVLVLIPWMAAGLCLALLVGAWNPILQRLAPGFDVPYFILVLFCGATAIQALAWALPRRPSQFWPGVALLFPMVFLVAIMPQESRLWAGKRPETIRILCGAILVLAVGGFYAARRNRCGDWSGELRLDWIQQLWWSGRPRRRALRSPAAALFWADTLGAVRMVFLTWVIFALLIVSLLTLQLVLNQRGPGLGLRMVALVGVHSLPFLTIIWLAVGGLLLGGEPGAGFRTRLSSFRATWPVSTGQLAAQRIGSVLLAWLAVWAPVWILCLFYPSQAFEAMGGESYREVVASMIRSMTIGAQVAVGALPLFLWGRFDGFPNMLLCAIVSWAVPWLLSEGLHREEGQDPSWWYASSWLAMKWLVAATALGWSWWRGHITWRFAAALLGGWLAAVGLLIWGAPVSSAGRVWDVAALAVFLPLGRLALCPMALAANRHR